MKFNNLKNISIAFSEMLIIIFVNTFLMICNLPVWLNAIFYLLLLFEIVFLLLITKNKFNPTTKLPVIISFMMLVFLLLLKMIIGVFIDIPVICIASYEFLMGYLFLNTLINISTLYTGKKHNSILIIIGSVVFILSIIMGFLGLFGLAS